MDLEKTARGLAAGTWLALLAWFWVWLAVLPEPAGKQSPALALAVTLLMILPLRGVVAGTPRSLIWAAYLALLWFMFGVVELWSAAGEFWSAGLTVALSVLYLVAAAYLTRRRR